MNRTTFVMLAAALFLIVDIILVSAHLAAENAPEDSEQEVRNPEPTCDTGTCDFQCGGNCGIQRCGCGR